MRAVAVFCGSRHGTDPAYADAARALGRHLAEAGVRLVYGGGDVGLMGVVADSAVEAGGVVVGVIPQRLVDREVAHHGLTELHVVETMHERKAMMGDLADGFVVLPGGLGTLEEIFEVLTWEVLGYHAKRAVFLDTGGFWQPLFAMLEEMVSSGFVDADTVARIGRVADPAKVLDRLRAG